MERVKILNEYYTNLDYDKKEKEVLKKLNGIFDMIQKCKFKSNDNLPKRLQILAEIIYQNMPFFSSIFKHIDVITTILDYLTKYSVLIPNEALIDTDYSFSELPTYLMITLVTICTGSVMYSFFSDCLKDVAQNTDTYYDNAYSITTHGTKKRLFILDVFQ